MCSVRVTGICRSGKWPISKKQGVEFAGLENDGLEIDGLENDGVEQEQTYMLQTKTNLNGYDPLRHTSQHRNGVSAAAGAPGTDAAADALAAVGVNCSASSSSELSACWLGVFSSPSFSSPANSVPANSATFNSCIRQILYTGRLYQF